MAFELVSQGKDLLGWIAWVWLWRLNSFRRERIYWGGLLGSGFGVCMLLVTGIGMLSIRTGDSSGIGNPLWHKVACKYLVCLLCLSLLI